MQNTSKLFKDVYKVHVKTSCGRNYPKPFTTAFVSLNPSRMLNQTNKNLQNFEQSSTMAEVVHTINTPEFTGKQLRDSAIKFCLQDANDDRNLEKKTINHGSKIIQISVL